jgi:hypothetical protein
VLELLAETAAAVADRVDEASPGDGPLVRQGLQALREAEVRAICARLAEADEPGLAHAVSALRIAARHAEYPGQFDIAELNLGLARRFALNA